MWHAAKLASQAAARSRPAAHAAGVWAVSAPAHSAQRVSATTSGVRWASGGAGGGSKGGADRAVATQEDPFSSLTDKIPVKPVTATETVSYSLVILAGLGVALAAAWAVLKELVFEPKEYTVFGLALERCRTHSVVAVRLGSPLTGYGVESNNRSARQRIRHKLGTDAQGRPTVTVQFQLRGPRGVATVLAEATQDADSPGGWRLNYVQCSDPHGHMAPIQVISPFEHQAAGGGAASQAGGFALGGAASGRA